MDKSFLLTVIKNRELCYNNIELFSNLHHFCILLLLFLRIHFNLMAWLPLYRILTVGILMLVWLFSLYKIRAYKKLLANSFNLPST